MQIPERSRFIGDEDDMQIWWEVNGALIDFSQPGYTYTLTVASVKDPTTLIFTKTSGFTGAAGSGGEGQSGAVPNLTVSWSAVGELNSIATQGRYILQIVARNGSSAETTLQMTLNMRARLG